MVAAHFADRRPVDAAAYPEVPESVIGNAASRRNAQIVEAFCDAMHYPAPSFAAAPSVAMRLEVKEGINDSILINDAYNLDLNSLALALDYLHSVALSRRRTLVLSDISQSGLTDDELYSRVAGMVARAGKLTRPTTTATIPIGYADGLDRHLGCGRWSVLVAGQPAPIIGRVCMDSCMIDITDIPGVKEGDEVSVFSPVPGTDLETMARVLDTISYEIMTSVSGRVKRIYLKE